MGVIFHRRPGSALIGRLICQLIGQLICLSRHGSLPVYAGFVNHPRQLGVEGAAGQDLGVGIAFFGQDRPQGRDAGDASAPGNLECSFYDTCTRFHGTHRMPAVVEVVL
jgi:hypothetical protein